MKHILLLILLFSCASEQLVEQENLHINAYKKGIHYKDIGEMNLACTYFKDLKDTKSFLPQDLLTLQILKTCDLTEKQYTDIWNSTKINENHYLREDLLETYYKLSKKKKMYHIYSVVAHEYNNYPKINKEREKIAFELLKISEIAQGQSIKNAALDNLYSIAPRFIKAPTKDQYYEVARDFERVRSFSKARNYYQKVVLDKSQNDIIRMKAYYRKAMTYKLKRDKVTYSKVVAKMMTWMYKNKFEKKAENYDKVWVYRSLNVRAKWTIGNPSEAEKNILNYLKFKNIKASTKSEFYLILGQIYAEKKNYKKANMFFEQGLDQKNIKDEFLEKLSWSLAWNYYLTKEYAKCISSLEKAINQFDDFKESRKHLYWKARSLDKLGKHGVSKEIYTRLANDDTYGYYGILSSMHMKKVLPKVSFDKYPPTHSDDNYLRWLNDLGEFDIIKKYLKKSKKVHEFTDYHYSKWFEGGIYKFFSLSSEDKDEAYMNDLPLAFPTPYIRETKTIAEKVNIPAAFIFSIARQESAFNTTARSWADAFGLLQVTPEKAKKLSRRYKIPYKQIEDLYVPNTNLKMGAHLLKELSSRTDGKFITIVAAYNAGKNPIYRWYKTRKRKDPIEFIEMIPYRETKAYVKLVLRNYVTYQRLLGQNVNFTREFFKNKFF
jgi:soluble lytic murein transglycosylase